MRTVQSFRFGPLGKRFVMIIKAKVNPSQRSPDDAHEPWLVVKQKEKLLLFIAPAWQGKFKILILN